MNQARPPILTIHDPSQHVGACSTRALFARTLIASCVATLGAVSCATPPPPPPIEVVVATRAESGAPVPNAAIYAGPSLVATSDADGRARLDVSGAEGDTFELVVKCPPGFRSPASPLLVRRFAIAAAASSPQYEITCHETRHVVVVAVRADGGADLPLMYLGQEIARTDASGAAHVLVEMEVHDRVELMLATSSGKDVDKIHPQNPAAVFEMPEQDDVLFFSVAFTRDAKKAAPQWTPRGPVAF